jgi:serine/threonine protein kinase
MGRLGSGCSHREWSPNVFFTLRKGWFRSASMLEISGRTVGEYQILERVGHGGMSAIYKAVDMTDDSIVAFKVLSAAMVSDPTFEARFSREIEVLRSLNHRNILPILDYGEIDGSAYIVMPFYEHGTLQDRIDKGLTLKQGAKIIKQISNALEYAHRQGITHRDVKPSNILLDERGNAVLSDFGFAHLSEASKSLTGSALIGTPAYMSPEQCRGEDINPLSDQYSLAVVMYQMITGRLPFEADTPMALVFKHLNDPVPYPRDINPRIPEEVEAVLLKALSKNPERRFASVKALNQALQDAVWPQKSGQAALTLSWRKLRSRYRGKQRRISQTITALSRSKTFMQGARVALVLSIAVTVPAAIWSLITFGANIADATDRIVSSNGTPTPNQTVIALAVQGTLAAQGEGTSVPLDVVQTAVAATEYARLSSLPEEGARATPTPSRTPWPYNPAPTRTPTRPPAATPTPALTMHVDYLDEKAEEKDGLWQAVVKVYVVDGNGDEIEHATVTGTWSVFGEDVKFSCDTKKRGECDLKSGWISPSESTTLTVTNIEFTPYTYAPEDNLVSEIIILPP